MQPGWTCIYDPHLLCNFALVLPIVDFFLVLCFSQLLVLFSTEIKQNDLIVVQEMLLAAESPSVKKRRQKE